MPNPYQELGATLGGLFFNPNKGVAYRDQMDKNARSQKLMAEARDAQAMSMDRAAVTAESLGKAYPTLPPDLALMLKAFVTLEGMGRELDPDFDMAAVALPYLRRALAEQYSPRALARRGWHVLSSTMSLVASLPRDLRHILRLARRGKLHVEVEITSLKPFGDQLDRAVSRLTVGLVTSALIIGSAIVMNIKGPIALSTISGFGVLGFIGAALGGVWVLISILRGGRR